MRHLKQYPINLRKECIDLWPGLIEQGLSFLRGLIPFYSTTLSLEDVVHGIRHPLDCSSILLKYLHSFCWLRDLKAAQLNDLRETARNLLLAWIESFDVYNSASFEPHIMGPRIVNWVLMYDFLTQGAPVSFLEDFNKSIETQIQYLFHSFHDLNDPFLSFQAIKGLLFTGYPHIAILDQILPKMLFKDGGHKTRSPLQQLLLLKDLVELRMIFPGTPILDETITLIVPIVRMLRHGDGKLSTFKGFSKDIPSYEIPSSWIDTTLSLAGIQGKPMARSPDMGYERYCKQESLIIMSLKDAITIEDSILSFEWSFERQRLLRRSFIKNLNLSKATDVIVKRYESLEKSLVDIVIKGSHILYQRNISLEKNRIKGIETIHMGQASCFCAEGQNQWDLTEKDTGFLISPHTTWALKVKEASLYKNDQTLYLTPISDSPVQWSFELVR